MSWWSLAAKALYVLSQTSRTKLTNRATADIVTKEDEETQERNNNKRECDR